MRIGDWSSDVCSSDLPPCWSRRRRPAARPWPSPGPQGARPAPCWSPRGPTAGPATGDRGRRRSREDRKSVVWGKSVSVRVALGGCRYINKTKLTIICEVESLLIQYDVSLLSVI